MNELIGDLYCVEISIWQVSHSNINIQTFETPHLHLLIINTTGLITTKIIFAPTSTPTSVFT